MLTILLAAAKYLGLLIAAALGVYGITHEYRRNGELTAAGKRARLLVIGAAALGIAAAGLEQYRVHADADARRLDEALRNRFADLTVTWKLSPRETAAFEEILQREARAAKPRPDDTWIVYIATALRGGELAVIPTGQGWRLDVTLNRPQGSLARRFADDTGEWRAFASAMQQLTGDRLELALTSGARVADLASVNWPTELVATRGVLTFRLQSPPVSPLDFRTAAMVVTHRGRFRPAALRLGSDDPRITLDYDVPLQWTETPWRTVTDPDGEPQVIPEFKSGPHPIPLGAAPVGASGSR